MTLRLGFQHWEICRGERCKSCEPIPLFGHRLAAVQWLQQFKVDTVAMSALRYEFSKDLISGLGDLGRLADDDMLDQLASLFSCGMWHVHEKEMVRIFAARPVRSSVDTGIWKTSREPQRAPVPKQPPIEVPTLDTLAANADQILIAWMMKEAARLGIPFCEECMKAAMHA